MKKLLAILIVIALILSLFTITASAASVWEMSAQGQMTFNVYKTSSPPALGGPINESTYGPALGTWSPGSPGSYYTFLDDIDKSDYDKILINWITWYMTYDDNYLYAGFVTSDDNHYTPLEGPAVWDGDYVGFDFNGTNFGPTWDDMNDRLRTAVGVSNTGDICVYYATNPPSGYVSHETGVDLGRAFGTASRDEAAKLTYHQIQYPWADLTPDGKPSAKAIINLYYGLAHSDFDGPYGGGYVGAFRVAASVSAAVAQSLGSASEADPQGVYHIVVFSGDRPVVAEVTPETPEESGAGGGEDADAEIADIIEEVVVARPTSPPTGDAGMIIFIALMAIAAAGAALFKKAKI